MSSFSTPFDFQGLRVTVMGLGRFGGGVGAVRFLTDRGARVTLTDIKTDDQLADSLAEIKDCPLENLCLGGHHERDFIEPDLVVASPAVPRSDRYLELARHAGIPITSEMNLFWQHNRGRVAGVTGSNGKSTTTALLHSMLTAAGLKCRLGGNIGGSLLPIVDQIEPDEWVVLELSSFQLEDLNHLPASPQVAVVTNFSPNHLDWHGSLAEYRSAKQAIIRWQTPDAAAVLNADDAEVSGWTSYGRRYSFGSTDNGQPGVFGDAARCIARCDNGELELPLAKWLKLPGRHNLQNALAATAAALSIGVDATAVERGLKDFTPLPHRLEPVGEVAGRSFYNDSLATTPESTAMALSSFSSPIVLLAGGYDKQVDLQLMAEAIADKAKAVALMGQTAEILEELIEQHDVPRSVQIKRCDSFEAAFAWACAQSQPGDVVLLSPGCASYDWFNNYAERGQRFVQLVEAWRKTMNASSPV
ncbi:MAG: UDP-N-acetylmuramoyl-L-alanine--D-glutamate ligase [Planctomycetaceae bacterium]